MVRRKQKLVNLFEDHSDSSPEDPYQDDGEHGSDQDYYPHGHPQASSSDTDDERSDNRPKQGKNSSVNKAMAKDEAHQYLAEGKMIELLTQELGQSVNTGPSLKKITAQTRKIINQMKAEKRNKQHALKQQNQLARSLLPDAPPRKRKCKQTSPERVPCRLVPGTPISPPPSKLQSWEIKKQSPSSSRPVNKVGAATPKSSCSTDAASLKIDRTSGLTKSEAKARNDILPVISNTTLLPSQHENDVSSPSAKKAEDAKISDQKYYEQFLSSMLELCGDGDTNNIDDIDDIHVDVNAETQNSTNFLGAAPELNDNLLNWLTNEDAANDNVLTSLMRDAINENDNLNFDWTNDYNDFKGQREQFTGTPGPTFKLDANTKPMDVFLKFFDDDFFQLLTYQTNEHASRVIARVLTTSSRLKKYKNTDRDELAVFIAVLILQGMAPFSVEKDYWHENGYLTLKYFKDLMSYNRYVLLKRLLHFENEKLTDGNKPINRLRKIQPVVDFLNEKFSTLYMPGREVAVDESLLKWKGRLSFSQKIATKAARRGVKTYELCESTTGYLWKFFIYAQKDQQIHSQTDPTADEQTGLKSDGDETIDLTVDGQIDLTGDSGEQFDQTRPDQTGDGQTGEPSEPINCTAKIVCDLIRPLLHRGHTVVTDNFYTSPLLARYLKSKGTDTYGTLRVNREFVPEAIKTMQKSQLREGEFVQSFCKDLTCTLWRDSFNLVAMLSTFHKGDIGGKEKHGRFKYKPQVVLDYNLYMGGVDKKDQLLASHPIERTRNMVWYKKVFRRLVNVTLLNSFIIFKSANTSITQRAFRMRVAEELVATFKKSNIPKTVVHKVNVFSATGKVRPVLLGNHFLGEGESSRRRCVFCCKSRTKYICKTCKEPLCIVNCFEAYHTR